MGRKRTWKYSLVRIAEASGVSVGRVRYDRRIGRLEPDSLKAVSVYVARHVLAGLNGGGGKAEEDEEGDGHPESDS